MDRDEPLRPWDVSVPRYQLSLASPESAVILGRSHLTCHPGRSEAERRDPDERGPG